MKGHVLFQGERIKYKILLKIFWKIFFSRTTGSVPIKLGTKHPWEMEIQVCLNEGPCSISRGDGSENVKLYWKKRNEKIISLGQFQPNLAQTIFGYSGFMFVQIKGHIFIQGEIIAKIWNSIENIKKIFSRTTGPVSTKIYAKHPWV